MLWVRELGDSYKLFLASTKSSSAPAAAPVQQLETVGGGDESNRGRV